MEQKIKDNVVRWGIIGVGDVCEVKSAPAMQIVPNSSLVAVMRRSGEKAADYARRHGVRKWYDQADELLGDPEVNAIYIATPPNTHASYTQMAAERGFPVYVEKPMARTHAECQQMIEVCEQNQVPLYVAYYRRALPNFQKVKSLVDEGCIGSVRAVNVTLVKPLEADIDTNAESNWRTSPEVAGGGYFFDLASHQLDFLDYLLGPIRRAQGMAANQAGKYKAEDIVTSSFQFDNGTLGSGLWCFSATECESQEMITLFGSLGTIRFQCFGDNHVILEDKKGKQVFSFEMPKHIQEPLITSVVDDLLGRDICQSTGISAARTNWVMDQMTK